MVLHQAPCRLSALGEERWRTDESHHALSKDLNFDPQTPESTAPSASSASHAQSVNFESAAVLILPTHAAPPHIHTCPSC